MSRCAHGTSPTKRLRNSAAVTDAARRFSTAFMMSPYLPLMRSAYSACSGSRQMISPARRPAAETAPPGAEARPAPLVVRAHQPGVRGAQRGDDRAGQRGEVDEPLGALLDRVV